MKLWMTVTALACALVLTSCTSVKAKEGGTAAGTQRGFLGMKKKAIEVDTEKAFAGAQKVVVGSFKLGFVEYKGASRKAGTGPGGVAKAKTTLLGLDDATWQRVTDKAYADFVAKLEAAGYEVVDRNQFASSAEMAKAKTYEAPYRKQNSIFSTGDELSVFTPSAFGNTMHIFGNDGLGMGGFAFANANLCASNYATATGTKVLSVNYVIDFLNAEGRGGSFSARASVAVGQGMSIRPGSSLALTGGQGGTFQKTNGTITLGQPIYSEETFGEFKDITTTTAKSVQYATNALGLLTGTSGSSITRVYELTADPEKYGAITLGLAMDANKTLVDTMVSKR